MVKHSHVVAIVVAAFLVWGLIGWVGGYLIHQANNSHPLGAQTINYSNSGGSTNLYNELASLLTDISSTRASLAGLLGGNATFSQTTLGPINTTTSTATTSVTITGAAVGDFVVVGESTSTTGVILGGYVSAANNVIIWKWNQNGANTTAATDTVYALLLPKGSFLAPPALNSSTSTSN